MYRELGVSRLIGVIAGFFTEFLRTIEKISGRNEPFPDLPEKHPAPPAIEDNSF